MTAPPERDYMFLDSAEDREELITQIASSRQTVRQLVEDIPEEDRYAPRYHGWSLGAMLGHLNLSDNLSLFLIRTALAGVPLQVSPGMLDRFNGFSTRMFQKRLVSSSLRGMDVNEERIATFIRRLPIDKFTVQVYHPAQGRFLTTERIVQELFLFHWHDHINEIRAGEQAVQEPSQKDDVV